MFEARSSALLVSCINFITCQSKKNRIPSKYIKKASWKAFLESDVKKLNWNAILKEKINNRANADATTVDKSINRHATMVNNMVERLGSIISKEDVMKRFAERSGYRLVKTY